MDRPDPKTAVIRGSGKAYLFIPQVRRDACAFDIENLDLVDGFLPLPYQFLNPRHCRPPPHRSGEYEVPHR